MDIGQSVESRDKGLLPTEQPDRDSGRGAPGRVEPPSRPGSAAGDKQELAILGRVADLPNHTT